MLPEKALLKGILKVLFYDEMRTFLIVDILQEVQISNDSNIS